MLLCGFDDLINLPSFSFTAIRLQESVECLVAPRFAERLLYSRDLSFGLACQYALDGGGVSAPQKRPQRLTSRTEPAACGTDFLCVLEGKGIVLVRFGSAHSIRYAGIVDAAAPRFEVVEYLCFCVREAFLFCPHCHDDAQKHQKDKDNQPAPKPVVLFLGRWVHGRLLSRWRIGCLLGRGRSTHDGRRRNGLRRGYGLYCGLLWCCHSGYRFQTSLPLPTMSIVLSARCAPSSKVMLEALSAVLFAA